MTTVQENFLNKIVKAVTKYAPKYDIKVYSPIIAQAILESGWGKSKLAEHNNFFGLKAGRSFKGETITLDTKEETKSGMVAVSAAFRKYKTLDAGVKGYFEFINIPRYENLKNVTDPETYLNNIKKDGYATSSTYVNSLMGLISSYNLTQYDPVKKTAEAKPKTKFDKSIEMCFDMIATDIVNNPQLYGNGETRKNTLYQETQKRVNSIIAKRC